MNIFNLGRKYEQLRNCLDNHLTADIDYRATVAKQLLELEKAIVDMQAAHSEELKEIRERLDMPQRRKSTVRPWSMLRSVAEAGERFMKEKTSA